MTDLLKKFKSIWLDRINKLTYGFIYPAFLGNMIYDIILMGFGDQANKFSHEELITSILITIYYLLDYMHLNADMKGIIDEDKDRVTLTYILCDIATSCLIFSAFVGVKLHHPEISMVFMASIPFFFLIYKCDIFTELFFILPYACTSVIYGLYFGYFYFIDGVGSMHDNPMHYLSYFVITSLSLYAFYVLFYFDLIGKKGYSVKNLPK